ncbi:hypothetical protein, partial [Klebsiella variicola]|uniref:hypothetical protein n=1 Tax=Klebsiella variicola TaxID=244366 RepID=UPI002730E3DD
RCLSKLSCSRYQHSPLDALVPLLLALFSVRAMAARGFFRFWLTIASSIALFLGLMEMDFYREFHQTSSATTSTPARNCAPRKALAAKPR